MTAIFRDRIVIVSCFLFLSSLTARGQDSPVILPLAMIDSLMVHESYREALDSLDAMPDVDATTDAAHRTLLMKIVGAEILPDSIIERFSASGVTYEQRFLGLHAGPLAAGIYAEYRSLLSEGRQTKAYQRYLVGDFFRTRHVVNEKMRLRNNLNRTRMLVRSLDFTGASEMVAVFEREEETAAFLQLKKELTDEYEKLIYEVNQGLRIHRYETNRQDLDKTFFVSVGTGMDPLFSLPFDKVLFIGGPTSYFILQGEGALITHPVIGWNLEAGMFAHPSLMAGLQYDLAVASDENTFLDANRVVRRFKSRVEYRKIGVWLRYYLDRRTGYRSFLGLMIGSGQKKLSPISIPDDPASLTLVEVIQSGLSLSPSAGVEYLHMGSSSRCRH